MPKMTPRIESKRTKTDQICSNFIWPLMTTPDGPKLVAEHNLPQRKTFLPALSSLA